jgi:hypothetical protein
LHAHFAELRAQIEHFIINKDTIDMEYAQRTYNHEYEVRGLYVSMGNVGTKSKGHKEGKDGSINLVETIRILQRDFLSYKADNERLLKS